MSFEEKVAYVTLMHFGDFDKLSDLKCKRCLDFREKVCKGRNFVGAAVLDCMVRQAQVAEVKLTTIF